MVREVEVGSGLIVTGWPGSGTCISLFVCLCGFLISCFISFSILHTSELALALYVCVAGWLVYWKCFFQNIKTANTLRNNELNHKSNDGK